MIIIILKQLDNKIHLLLIYLLFSLFQYLEKVYEMLKQTMEQQFINREFSTKIIDLKLELMEQKSKMFFNPNVKNDDIFKEFVIDLSLIEVLSLALNFFDEYFEECK